MKYFLLLLTILVCPYSISRSQTTLTTFERKELNMDGRVVRYRIATIKGESCNPAALVIYLHGGSGRGEWDWAPCFDLDSMTEDMIRHLRGKFAKTA